MSKEIERGVIPSLVESGDLKPNQKIEVTSASGSSTTIDDGQKWRQGLTPRIPYISIVLLTIVVGICVGIIVILENSNGKDVATWGHYHAGIASRHYAKTIPVSVWISSLALVANKCIAIAFAEAVTIAWWTAALKGVTVRQLHHNWAAGKSVVAVALNPKLFNWLCLASIFFTLFSVNTPLYQKATRQEIVLVTNFTSLSTSLARQLPPGWSGYDSQAARVGATGEVAYLSPLLLNIMQDFTTNSPIQLLVENCEANATCQGLFPGVGFDYQCEATSQYFDGSGFLPDATAEDISSDDSSYWDLDDSKVMFGVQVADPDSAIDWQMTLSTVHKTDTNCIGTVNVRNCTLTPALVAYQVTVLNGVATLTQSPTSHIVWNSSSDANETSTTIPVDPVLSTLSPLRGQNPDTTFWPNSTVGGLVVILKGLYDTITSVENGGTTGLQYSTTSSFASYFLNMNGRTGYDATEICNMTFSDPLPAVVANIRNIMFRTSIAIGSNYTEDYTTSNPGQSTTVTAARTFYFTNMKFLIAGTVVMLATVLTMLPLYWGFWKIGRKVSLSPLEMGKALHGAAESAQGQTVLSAARDTDGRHDGSNANADELIDLLGDVKVQYGEVAPQKLGIGLAEDVNKPKHGQLYL